LIRHIFVLAISLLCIVPCAFSTPGVWVGTPTDPDTVWTGHVPTSAINFNVSINSVGGSYEHVIGNNQGILIDGGMLTFDGYAIKLAYLRYLPRYTSEPAIVSPYLGAFVRYGQMIFDDDPNENGDHEYDLDMRSAHAGMFLGRSVMWSRYIRLSGRLGLGFPLYYDMHWTPERHPSGRILELASVFYVSVEITVSIGFVF
jgi:hypothetical protein